MGYIIAIMMFMSSVMGLWFFNQNQILIENSIHHSETESYINHIKIYADALEVFIKIKPVNQGEVADNQLNLPTWFTGDHRIKKQLFSGRGYVYLPAVPGLFESLHQALHGSLLLGRVNNQRIVHLTEGKLAIPLPPDIPDGYIVYVI